MVGTFDAAEYDSRLTRTRARMAGEGISDLFVSDPANIYYLTGYDACSFYVPQLLWISSTEPLHLFLREIDASSAWLTGNLAPDQVFGYPETYVQSSDRHPLEWVAGIIRARLPADAVAAVESESPHYTLRAHHALTAGLGRSLQPSPRLVNWVRAIKSPAEIEVMRTAARITERVFEVALDAVRPGVRQCDAVAEIYAAQIEGVPDAGGSYAAIPPIVLAGASTAFPHVPWSDEPFVADEAVALELAGARARYHVPLTRTMYLGTPPATLAALADVTGEGLDAALATMRPGVATGAPADAWTEVIARHGYVKKSRVGYPIGIGYAPDWGEQTMSLRPGETFPLEAGMTFHVMIGMWLDGGGYSISETVLVTEDGVECLTTVPRGLICS